MFMNFQMFQYLKGLAHSGPRGTICKQFLHFNITASIVTVIQCDYSHNIAATPSGEITV